MRHEETGIITIDPILVTEDREVTVTVQLRGKGLVMLTARLEGDGVNSPVLSWTASAHKPDPPHQYPGRCAPAVLPEIDHLKRCTLCAAPTQNTDGPGGPPLCLVCYVKGGRLTEGGL